MPYGENYIVDRKSSHVVFTIGRGLTGEEQYWATRVT